MWNKSQYIRKFGAIFAPRSETWGYILSDQETAIVVKLTNTYEHVLSSWDLRARSGKGYNFSQTNPKPPSYCQQATQVSYYKQTVDGLLTTDEREWKIANNGNSFNIKGPILVQRQKNVLYINAQSASCKPCHLYLGAFYFVPLTDAQRNYFGWK